MSIIISAPHLHYSYILAFYHVLLLIKLLSLHVTKFKFKSTFFLAQGNHNVVHSTLHSNRAACRIKIGDCEGCVKDCSEAMKLDDTAIKALIRRASAYETMEKYAFWHNILFFNS